MLHKPVGRRVRRGSILILVVALLGVLFVAGLGFLAVTSNDRRSAVANRINTSIVVETDGALQNVVAALSASLWDSNGGFLTGQGGNPAWTYPCSNAAPNFGINDNAWLASTFPTWTGTTWQWPHISNLSGQANFGAGTPDTTVLASTLDADADGDGILDSRWMLSSSRRYRIAYRVVDLCGMINLNTAGRGFHDDMGTTVYNVAMTSVTAGWYENDGYYGPGTKMGMLAEPSNAFSGGGDQNVCGRGTQPYDSQNQAGEGYLPRNWDPTKTFCYPDYSSYLDNPYIRTGTATIYPSLTPVFRGFPDATPFRLSDDVALHSYGTAVGPVPTRFERIWGDASRTPAGTFSTIRNQMPNITTPAATDSLRTCYTSYNWTRDVLSIPTTGTPPAVGGVATIWQYWIEFINTYYGLPVGNKVVPPVNINGTLAHGATNPHDPVYTRALAAAIVLSGAMTDVDAGVTNLTQQQVEQLVVNIVSFRDSVGNVSQTVDATDGATFVDTVFSKGPGYAGKVYGVTRQVFITALGASVGSAIYFTGTPPILTCPAYAMTLNNPYADAVDISGWKIFTPGGIVTIPAGTTVAPSGHYTICNQAKYPIAAAPFYKSTWNANAQLTDPALNFGVDYATNSVTAIAGIPQAGDIYLARPSKTGGSTNMVVVDRVSFNPSLTPTAAGQPFGARKPVLGSAPGSAWLVILKTGTVVNTWRLYRGEREWMQARDDAYKCSTVLGASNSFLDGVPYTSPWYWSPYQAASLTNDYNSTTYLNGYTTPRDGRQLPIVAGIWANRAVGAVPIWTCNSPTGQPYLVGQVVSNGAQYQCVMSHMAAAADATGGLDHGHLDGNAGYASHPPYYYWKLYDPAVAANQYGKFDTLGQLHWMFLDTGPQGTSAADYATIATAAPKPPTNRMTALIGTAVNTLCVDFTNPARAEFKILKNFCCNERSMTSVDHNGDGYTAISPDPRPTNLPVPTGWDRAEWRVSGKININTAPPYVLQALSFYLAPTDSYYSQSFPKSSYLGNNYHLNLYNARNDAASVGFKKGIGQAGSIFAGSCQTLMSAVAVGNSPASCMNGWGNLPSNSMISGMAFAQNYMDNVSNRRADLKFYDLGFAADGTYSRVKNASNDIDPDPPVNPPGNGTTWIHPQRGWYDHNERHFIFDRISDVMTTRSDTFLVYILVQEIDTSTGAWNALVGQPQPTVLQSRRMVAIIDRSMCNFPPSATDASGNSIYVSPQVVARSITTW